MTWFKVDDKLHSNSKVRKVLAECPSALALWTVAGSWSSDNTSDGFVPDHQLQWLMPAGVDGLATALVTARLWRRVRGGYQFHDWFDFQPSKQETAQSRERMSSGGALGNHRRWHIEKGVSDPSCRYCQGKQNRVDGSPPDRLPDGLPESGANPPVPSRPGPEKQPPLPPKGGESNPAFDAFWAVYPRKVGKPKGLKAWLAALKRGHDPDKITDAARRYATTRRGQDAQYTAHPATWLNDQRYNDPEPQVTNDEAGWWNN